MTTSKRLEFPESHAAMQHNPGRGIMDQLGAAGAVAVEYPAVGIALFNAPGPLGTGEYGGEAAP
jgi:hypothetical protein